MLLKYVKCVVSAMKEMENDRLAVLEYGRTYCRTHSKDIMKRNFKYYQSHCEDACEYSREYYQSHREDAREYIIRLIESEYT